MFKCRPHFSIFLRCLGGVHCLLCLDFKANLGRIIHDIYQTAHLMFGDMPQGDHKKRAKYRFASKTLMRLLPKELLGQVNSLITIIISMV